MYIIFHLVTMMSLVVGLPIIIGQLSIFKNLRVLKIQSHRVDMRYSTIVVCKV
jgi:hypothetical protein